MQVTAHGNPRREGGVHTIGAPWSRVAWKLFVNVSSAVMSTACWCEGCLRWPWWFVRVALRPIIRSRSYWRWPLFGLPSLFRWFTSLRRRPRCWSPRRRKLPIE